MKSFVADMNPTLRGFLLIAALAGVIVLLNLEGLVSIVWTVLRIVFVIAIVVFLYFLWRQRRSDIETWSGRARWAFYGAGALIAADLVLALVLGIPAGLGALAFVLVLGICGFSMFRLWRDEHAYG